MTDSAGWVLGALLCVVLVLAILLVRQRRRLVRSLREQRALVAIAGLPVPGATPEATVERVTELLVPRITSYAAIDVTRGEQRIRMGERGAAPGSETRLIEAPLRARGYEIGALTIAHGRDGLAPDFVTVLAGRVALALDNAGLSLELLTVEQRLEAILANLGEAVTVQDESGTVVFANQAAADLLGAASVEELLATPPLELVERFETFNEDGTPLRLDQLPGRHVLAGERSDPLTVRTISKETGLETWRLTKSTPVYGPDGRVALAVNIIEDITEAKRAELSQRLLADASAALASSLDYTHTLQRISEIAVPKLADWCFVSLPQAGLLTPVAMAHGDPAKIEVIRRYGERFPARIDAPQGSGRVFRTGEPQLVPAVDDMLDAALLEPEQRGQHRQVPRPHDGQPDLAPVAVQHGPHPGPLVHPQAADLRPGQAAGSHHAVGHHGVRPHDRPGAQQPHRDRQRQQIEHLQPRCTESDRRHADGKPPHRDQGGERSSEGDSGSVGHRTMVAGQGR